MNVRQYENRVWQVDNLRIVVRARRATRIAQRFGWTNGIDQGLSITDYIRNRVTPCIGSREFLIIDGHGNEPHGRTLMSTVRDSYHH